MSRSKNNLYKSTLKFLSDASSDEIKGAALRRLHVLCGMVCSCLSTRTGSLEGLSRQTFMLEDSPDTSDGLAADEKQSESCIKQAKRWLSSKWTDWDTFYAPYVRPIITRAASTGELILIIDGSETAAGCVSLMLSLVWRGFAVPLTWITRSGKKGHFPEDMHVELIKFAQKILPADCRIVLLGDGEFDGENLRKHCRAYQWEFVLRTSKDHLIDCGDACKVRFDTLCPDQTTPAVFVPDACEGDNGVMWHDPKHEKPIFLITNMDVGDMACAYYKRRFKIEVLFKHMKSNGFNVQKSKISSPQRVYNLLIVICLAFLLAFCAGLYLKTQTKDVLVKITRADRTAKMSPVVLAQKCAQADKKTFDTVFSIISKNFNLFLLNLT